MVDTKRIELFMTTAQAMGLKPSIADERGLLCIEVNGTKRYLFHKSSNPNSAMASWLSENKYMSRVIFEQHGLPNIPFCLPADMDEAKSFLAEHGRIVVKPLKGRKSQNVHLVANDEELEKLDIQGCVAEKFIKGQEVRFLVVEGQVAAVHHKVYKADINNPDIVRRVSLEKSDWDEQLVPAAIKAAAAIGLVFTAVDFLVTAEGQAYLLEINSAPGLERFQQPDQGPAIDAMRLYLEQVIKNNA